METLAYSGDDFHMMLRMVMGDGDGLVNLVSLLAVDPVWRRRMLKVRNVSHKGLFVDDAALAVIINAIMQHN